MTQCTNVQNGGDCVDFGCTLFQSHVINPLRNTIRCRSSLWVEPRIKDYCVFCPHGERKVNLTHCEPCEKGKYLISGEDNDNRTCHDCPAGQYQPREGGATCIDCPAGRFQSKTGQSECIECLAGQYNAKQSKSETCKSCSPGTFQPDKGQISCIGCPLGQFQDQEGAVGCNTCAGGHSCARVYEKQSKCEKGKYQPDTNQRKCQVCPSGRFQPEDGQIECERCAPGQFTSETGLSKCQLCPKGQYQSDKGQVHCLDCPAGKSQSNISQPKCNNCSAGRYTERPGQFECQACPKGRFQTAAGQLACKKCAQGFFKAEEGDSTCVAADPGHYAQFASQNQQECPTGKYQPSKANVKCIDCEFYAFCPNTAMTVAYVHPLAIIVPIVVVLVAIYPCFKLVKIIHRGFTQWRPQSKHDALLAKKFVVPKTSEDAKGHIPIFKECESRLLENGSWAQEDLDIINNHRDVVVQYLVKRVEGASDPQQIKIMHCCLEMDVLHDFKTLYHATMKNICAKEADGFKVYTQVAQELKAAAPPSNCPANPSDLIELYKSGRNVYDRFHEFIKRASTVSRSGFLLLPHGGKGRVRMKGIYRVLEKAVFKYNDDLTGDLDFSWIGNFKTC